MGDLNIIVCVEPVLRPVDKNAVEAALQIRERRGGRVTLLAPAPARGGEKLRDGLAMGCDRAVLLRPGSPAAPVLAEAVKKLGRFDLVLTGLEGAGHRLTGAVPQLAGLLGAAHLSGVVGLDVRADGGVTVRARRGGWLLEVRGCCPLVLGVHREINTPRHTSLEGILAATAKTVEQWDTVLAGSLSEEWVPIAAASPQPDRRGEMLTGDPEALVRRLAGIIREALGASLRPDAGDPGLAVVSVVREERPVVCLEDATIIVAGGWGVGSVENWRHLEELARLLGGAVGCTRPAVDEGWAPVQAMIGTSGLTVEPDLYLGIGLSGDRHHLSGVRGAGLIIAVNNDPAAPVFREADFCVTADCREILPLLVAALQPAMSHQK